MGIKPPEHDTTCQRCGAPVPAGTPQRFWMGLPKCPPCDEYGVEAYGNYKRRSIEHHKRMQELEASDHDRATRSDPGLGNTL